MAIEDVTGEDFGQLFIKFAKANYFRNNHYPSDQQYMLSRPISYSMTLIDLKVKSKEEFLISGKYEPTENIRYSNEYIFYTNITYTNIVVRDIVEHEAPGSIMGRCGIREVPEPC